MMMTMLREHAVAVFVCGATIFTFAMCLAVILPPVDEYRTWRYANDVLTRHAANLRTLERMFAHRKQLRRPGAHRAPYRPQPTYPATVPVRAVAPVVSAPAPAAAGHVELLLSGVGGEPTP